MELNVKGGSFSIIIIYVKGIKYANILGILWSFNF